jgi:hypothetical protein
VPLPRGAGAPVTAVLLAILQGCPDTGLATAAFLFLCAVVELCAAALDVARAVRRAS